MVVPKVPLKVADRPRIEGHIGIRDSITLRKKIIHFPVGKRYQSTVPNIKGNRKGLERQQSDQKNAEIYFVAFLIITLCDQKTLSILLNSVESTSASPLLADDERS